MFRSDRRPSRGVGHPGRQTETLRYPCGRTLQDALGSIDQIVNDFTCALALVDHAGNLPTQKRTLLHLPTLFNDYGQRIKFSGQVVTVMCLEDNTLVKAAVDSPGLGRVLVVDGGA